jgi:GNAT superfamily N-acetyltransferase
LSEHVRSPLSDGVVTVRDFRSAEEPRVLELLQGAFGRWPRDVDTVQPQEFFRWKHQSSPFGPSTMLVAEIEGAPVGFMAKMPWWFSFDGQLRKTMRTVDLAVDSAARRRGVSMQLMEAGTSRHSDDVVLAWSNPNERSRGGAVKAGRGEVAMRRRYVGLGGARWRTLGRMQSRAGASPPHRAAGGERAGALLEDRALVARLLGGSRPGPGQITTAVNPEFLLWRYGWSETYRGVLATHAGHSGLAIFRIQQRGRFSLALICELLVERNDPRLTRRLVQSVRRAAAADLVVAAFASNRLAARCGLAPLLSGTTMSVHPQREGLLPDPTRQASWALSLGDFELI